MAYGNLPGSQYSDLYTKYNQDQDPGVTPGQYANPSLGGITRSAQAPAPVAAAKSTSAAAVTGPNQYAGQPATATPSSSSINTTDISSKLPDYLQAIAGSLSKMLTPPTFDIGLSGKENQSLLNQNRLNIQGNTNTALEQAREGLGNSGLNPGESGYADSAIGQIIRSGQSNLAASQTDLVNQAIQQRFAQEQAQQQAYQTQLGTMGNLMSALYPSAQFAQEFPYQQQQDALSQLQALYGNTASANSSAWSPYLSAVSGAIGK